MKIIRTINLIPINKKNNKILLVKKPSFDESRPKWTFPGQMIKTERSWSQIISNLIRTNLNCNVLDLEPFKKYESKTKNSVIKSQYLVGKISLEFENKKYLEIKWFDLNEELFFEEFMHNEKDIIADYIKTIE